MEKILPSYCKGPILHSSDDKELKDDKVTKEEEEIAKDKEVNNDIVNEYIFSNVI